MQEARTRTTIIRAIQEMIRKPGEKYNIYLDVQLSCI